MAGTVPTTESARATTTRELATAGRAQRGPLLPILHAVMAEHGWVSDEDIAVIADVLNLSRADVHGVVGFYNDFRRTPAPAHRVQVCRGEACQAVGAQALYAAAQARFPAGSMAWDFNYRGNLLFLEYAVAQGIRAVDGWEYFLHGWSQIMARVFSFDLTPELFAAMRDEAERRRS